MGKRYVEVSGERTPEVRAALTGAGIAIVGSHRLAVGPGTTLPIQTFTAIVEADSAQDAEQQVRAALSKFGGYDVADRGEAV